uniref:Uncharacterized protein n=1 Tax=Oryza brachyantha TaxID=4533 RepID=J3KZG4_ORYBR
MVRSLPDILRVEKVIVPEGARHRPQSTSPVITGAAIDVDERGGGGSGGSSTVIELLQPQRLAGGEQVRSEGEEQERSHKQIVKQEDDSLAKEKLNTLIALLNFEYK